MTLTRRYQPTRGRMSRISTKRHHRLCQRNGHRTGVKSWYQSVDGSTWERRAEPWCPRCQRPVTFRFTPPMPPEVYVAHACVEDCAPQQLVTYTQMEDGK